MKFIEDQEKTLVRLSKLENKIAIYEILQNSVDK